MDVDATPLWVALGLSTLLAMVAVAMSGTDDDSDGYRRIRHPMIGAPLRAAGHLFFLPRDGCLNQKPGSRVGGTGGSRMDTRPLIIAAALVLTACAGFLIGFNSMPEPQQIALNWPVPSGADAYPHFVR